MIIVANRVMTLIEEMIIRGMITLIERIIITEEMIIIDKPTKSIPTRAIGLVERGLFHITDKIGLIELAKIVIPVNIPTIPFTIELNTIILL